MGGEDRVSGPRGSSSGGSSLAAGTVVAGKYRLEHPLGSGGMGVVWAGRHIESGAAVALKFLRRDPGAPEDPDSRKRFLREARAAAAVQHPHVVAIREVLEQTNDPPVLVMELLGGESLRTRLNRGPRLSVEETARILLPVASAVGAAHAQGIVHRDLKPDNIFLSRDAQGAPLVKVVDFGIAKVTRPADDQANQADQANLGQGLTGSGEVLGTPHYMSPEQVFGERDIDQRADIWALGVILYECLSGVVPTRAPNVGQVFKLIVAGGIKPLETVAREAPADLVQLAHRMLARRRVERPFDLNEIAQVLRRHTGLRVPAFGAPRIPGVAPPAEPATNAAEIGAPAGEALRPARAPRLTTLGLAALVISVLVVESFLLWRARSRQPGISADEPAATASAAVGDAAAPPPLPQQARAPGSP
jgi:serine/threonine protein kinase